MGRCPEDWERDSGVVDSVVLVTVHTRWSVAVEASALMGQSPELTSVVGRDERGQGATILLVRE